MPDDQGKTPKIDDFSLFDAATASNPYAYYRALHSGGCPVHKPKDADFYVIGGYDDLRTALRDPTTFSNVMERARLLQAPEVAQAFIDTLREKGWEHVPTLQRLDPPEHTRHRKLLDRVLTPRHAKDLVPRVQALAHELIDKFIDRGECEFVEDFGVPLPCTIIAEQIGLDAGDIKQFRLWSENMLAYSTRKLTLEQMREAAEIEVQMQHYLARVFEDRRNNPRDDLMSEMLKVDEGEEPLTMHELQNLMHVLISGGFDTVTTGLNHMMWQMVRFPEIVEEIRTDRKLVRSFIEEGLRWETPTQGLWRKATKDTELSGASIPAGTLCQVRYASGNHDPNKFPDPERFDIRRGNLSAHIAFGNGPHFCPGAFLARTELNVACEAILDRMKDFRLSRPLPDPVHKPSVNLSQMKELWIGFSKA